MKRFIGILTAVLLGTAVYAQSFSVTEQATYVDYSAVVELSDVKTNVACTLKGFGSLTTVQFNYKDYVDVKSDFTYVNNYICSDSTVTGTYNLSDSLFVTGGLTYKYVNATFVPYSTEYNHLMIYAGLGAKGTWKFIDVKGTGYIGYNCIDNLTRTSSYEAIGTHSVSEGNAGYVNLRLDVTMFDYITFYAGMESYQTLFGNTLFWSPSSVNNYIGLKGEYSFNNHFTVVGQVYHFCRHAEVPSNTVRDSKEEVATVASIGLKVSF